MTIPNGLKLTQKRLLSNWDSIDTRCINGTGNRERNIKNLNHITNIPRFPTKPKSFRFRMLPKMNEFTDGGYNQNQILCSIMIGSEANRKCFL